MTLETEFVEKCRFLEQCQPSDLYDPLEGSQDHSASGRQIQCLNCHWSGPVVEGEWDYVDPRQGAFDRRCVKRDDLKKLRKSINQFIIVVSCNGLGPVHSAPYACGKDAVDG